jgi:two-component system phosphate regulon response regulator PhoB
MSVGTPCGGRVVLDWTMDRFEPAVLIVDDDAAVRRTLVALVASRGYQVVEASDGDQAWTQLLSEPLDVVVSDLQMPHCDGRELCRRIRAEPSLRDIRVVIVSGGLDPLDAQDLNCDSVLTKPISVSTLLREIERAPMSAARADAGRTSSGDVASRRRTEPV